MKLSVGLTPEQVEERRKGIGGSDAAAVLGVSRYKGPLDIYEEKLALRPPTAPTPAMRRGIALEPVARALYVEVTGRKVRRQPNKVHPSYPWMRCLVDGQIVGDKRGPGVQELKCPGVWMFAKIKREGLPLEWLVQMHHNIAAAGTKWGSFGVFSAELWEMVHFDVERDDTLIEGMIVTEQTFWLQRVEKRIPPEAAPQDPNLAALLAKAQKDAPAGELVQRTDAEWAEAAAQLLEAKEIGETAEQLEEAAKERLKSLMGAPSAVEGAGLRIYWTEKPGKRSFDKAALAAAHPEIDLTQFEKVGNPFQEFRTYRVSARTEE